MTESTPETAPAHDASPGPLADEATRARVAEVRQALEAVADEERAEPMAAYLRHRFPFLGVATPQRRAAQKPTLDGIRGADGDTLLAFAEACWREPERELHQVAVDALRRHHKALDAHHLDRVEALIVSNAWWDSVDSLGPHTVGPLVSRHRELVPVMDTWVDDTDRWLVRAALLHQLLARDGTDADRLFRHCARRASNRDPFIAKAVGWALRQYGRTDPDAVRAFVHEQGDRLAPLARREALKRL